MIKSENELRSDLYIAAWLVNGEVRFFRSGPDPVGLQSRVNEDRKHFRGIEREGEVKIYGPYRLAPC